MPHLAYLGLGSNLGDPHAQLESALRAIDSIGMRVVATSRFYATPPWGRTAQPDFVNAVAAVETPLQARELLDRLLDIERRAGRTRDGERWGPRVLDLDILAFDDQVIDEPALRVPHPHLHERAFVLVPFAEIAPGFVVPGRGRVEDLLKAVDATLCTPLESAGAATK